MACSLEDRAAPANQAGLVVRREGIHEDVEQGFAFHAAGGKQLLDDLENGHNVAFRRLTELCNQQDCRGQKSLRGIVKKLILPIARTISTRHDDGLGDNFCVLLGAGFVGQLALLLVQIGVFVDKVQEVKAIAFRGVAQVNDGHPVAVAVPGDACVIPKNVVE